MNFWTFLVVVLFGIACIAWGAYVCTDNELTEVKAKLNRQKNWKHIYKASKKQYERKIAEMEVEIESLRWVADIDIDEEKE